MCLQLCDLIKLAGIDLGGFKIHLATGSQSPPLIAYFDGKFKEWQEYQTRRNFQCETVVSLIQLHADKWLFVGVWKINGVSRRMTPQKSWFEYATTEVEGLEHLAGRVVVQFARSFRASYLHGSRYAERLVVAQILEDKMSMADFPGYSSVLLSFDQLRHIVDRNLEAWRAALKSVAGIYLVSDASCGKLYVGSAYGTDGIWGRWCTYASSMHGHNRELKELIAKLGNAHAKHFQFSILEICDVMETQDQVLARENHWKTALRSREFGYNSN